MSNNITIASYRTGLYFSFFSFLRKGEVCTVAHYLQCNMIQLPEGEKSQPIVQGLYMDWTLRTKFPCLKNVTPPPLSLWHSFIWKLYIWNLVLEGRWKSLLRSDTNEGHLCCILKRNFSAFWSQIFYYFFFFLKNGFVTVIKKSYKNDWSTAGLHQLRILHIFL